jgi:hypothetical protein
MNLSFFMPIDFARTYVFGAGAQHCLARDIHNIEQGRPLGCSRLQWEDLRVISSSQGQRLRPRLLAWGFSMTFMMTTRNFDIACDWLPNDRSPSLSRVRQLGQDSTSRF